MPAVTIHFNKHAKRQLKKYAKKYGLTPEQFVRYVTLRRIDSCVDLEILKAVLAKCDPEKAADLTFLDAMERVLVNLEDPTSFIV